MSRVRRSFEVFPDVTVVHFKFLLSGGGFLPLTG